MINYVELLALCNRQAKRIEELECINSELEKFYFEVAKELLEKDSILSEVQEHINHLMKDCIVYTKNKFEAHNLEQQARGIKDACDFANDKCINGGGYFGRDYESRFKQNGAFAFKSACMLYLKQLRNQARGE